MGETIELFSWNTSEWAGLQSWRPADLKGLYIPKGWGGGPKRGKTDKMKEGDERKGTVIG